MQFVKDPPQAGLVELQEPLGHPSSPAWSPKWQLRVAHTSKCGGGGDTPTSTSSPAAFGTTAPHQGSGGWLGSPHKTWGVLGPAPCPWGAVGVQEWL